MNLYTSAHYKEVIAIDEKYDIDLNQTFLFRVFDIQIENAIKEYKLRNKVENLRQSEKHIIFSELFSRLEEKYFNEEIADILQNYDYKRRAKEFRRFNSAMYSKKKYREALNKPVYLVKRDTPKKAKKSK